MKSRCALIILFLSCLGAATLAQDPDKKPRDRDMIGTNLESHLCKTAQDEHDEDVRICKGVAGYSLQLKGSETKPRISVIAPDGTRHPIDYWDLSDPEFHSIQPSVLWIVVNAPTKSIAFDLRLRVERKPDAPWGHHDVIVRVSPGPVCIIASLPASPRSSSETVQIAGSPETRPCLTSTRSTKRID